MGTCNIMKQYNIAGEIYQCTHLQLHVVVFQSFTTVRVSDTHKDMSISPFIIDFQP